MSGGLRFQLYFGEEAVESFRPAKKHFPGDRIPEIGIFIELIVLQSIAQRIVDNIIAIIADFGDAPFMTDPDMPFLITQYPNIISLGNPFFILTTVKSPEDELYLFKPAPVPTTWYHFRHAYRIQTIVAQAFIITRHVHKSYRSNLSLTLNSGFLFSKVIRNFRSYP